MSLIVCAADKKDKKLTKPRQVQPHFVGAGRPKDHMTKKKPKFDTKKWFVSTTQLKKRKQKEIAQETEKQKNRPFYQKTQN